MAQTLNGGTKGKLRPGHIVMLALSCVFLWIVAAASVDFLELLRAAPNADPPADGTGMGWFGIFVGEALYGFAVGLLLTILIPYWCAGMILAVIPAIRKSSTPRPVWIASLVLIAAYLILLCVVLVLGLIP